MNTGFPEDVREARESRAGTNSTASSAFAEAVWHELRADQTAGKDGFSKALREFTDAATLNTSLDAFKKDSQLKVVKKGDEYEYALAANGKDNILFKTPATLDGLKDARKQVDKLVDDKLVDLEKRFKVRFSVENEFVSKQKIEQPNCSITRGIDVLARRPNMHELAAIESGFAHAAPTHLSANGSQGLKIYFLKEPYYKAGGAIAYYIDSDKNNQPALYFDPGETDGIPATEKDAKVGKHHVNGRLIDSVAAVIIHECAHNEQNNHNLDLPNNKAALYKKFGWVSYVDPSSKETRYLMEGKNGTLYSYHHDDCSQPKRWTVCDNLGHPLDKDGKPTTDSKKYVTISKEDLRTKAKITPPTEYFNNILEEHADSATAFRIDADRRGRLLKESPAIYNAVKTWDNEDIISAYGIDKHGQPNKMRSPDGDIVENNVANRKILDDWEKAHR